MKDQNLPIDAIYISVTRFAEKYGVSERTARNYCATGKIEGAFLTGKTWNIPADTALPKKGKAKLSPLLERLRQEKQGRLKGGIYHRTQIDLTYNSNHIEGSRLTKEQTRFIFETNTLGATSENTRIDDIMETVNHFRCIDYVIDHATDKVTEAHIKQLHRILKANTSDSQKDWFVVGDYKKLPNEVGEEKTVEPKAVHKHMAKLISDINSKGTISLDDVIDFHVKFERIHPFQDGNGRVGRLLMLWQCLQNRIVPFIISEELRLFYYRGIQKWGRVNEFMQDTCLTAQDNYKALLDYFKIKY
ncbi:Fic family protein [Fibrobacter sp. UWP2]|uniref:Fic family protein n=1 Tax=Fibrobacter sp. UWP2 TaxID=1896216 RepID=UPI00090F8AC7|nr:Fic family protein [Fibrobacter sp. UWP2]SHI86075.1 Fic/DOC family protein [Fibrobacter sp. UWP2]